MDLNKINKYLERINNSDRHSFSASIKHLFSYLDKVAQSNAMFQRYELERNKWVNWPSNADGSFGVDWELPTDIEEAKSLAYDVYRSAGEQNDDGGGLSHHLFMNTNLNQNIYSFNESFLKFFIEALEDISNDESEKKLNHEMRSELGNKVFIVHGHDDDLKREIQLLLSRVELEDVVLHEQADKGRNIIDKLIEEGASACYVIALICQEDLMADGSFRARQNVVLEIGYFLGKLGKDRVRLLKKGDIEIPSDLHGILYTDYAGREDWKIKLLKEMQAVGIEIDIGKVISKY